MRGAYFISEVWRTLKEEIARQFAAHPRGSVAVTSAVAVVVVVIAWTVAVAVLYPPKRNTYGSVSGTVTSITGGPVSDAVVLFVNESVGSGTSARTDSGGHFTAQGIRTGRYAVAIQPAIAIGNTELTQEEALAARNRLENSVPLRFQEASTSGLSATLGLGRNRYDIDLRESK